ncbi:MAG: hypothetical protein E6J14_07600 [Chloroflexi bacterium]|nr:MAG: hypothetical protein E6J14_07600 [Chloroflexota bacterium]
MSGDLPAGTFGIGTRVSFPYGGSRRVGLVADASVMPDGNGGTTVAYLIDVGSRKVFVQGGVTAAGEGPAQPFDPVAEGVAYGRKRPRNARR